MASKIPFRSEYERKKNTPKKLSENLFYKDLNFMFNRCNELWTEYSLPAIGDKGREIKEYTSWKLKDKVLYLETELKRYEISRNLSDHTNDDYLFEEFETFRISEVKDHFNKDNDFMLMNAVPFSDEYVDCVFSRVDWHEFNWGENSLLIRNLEINNIKCFNFYNIK